MRLYIIRHADPDYENNTITKAGHEEAKALATYLQHEGISKIYSSPLGRALDTASYTVDALGVEPVVLDWAQELNLFLPYDDPRVHAAWDVHGHDLRESYEKTSCANCFDADFFAHPRIRESYEFVCTHSDRFMAEELGFNRKGGHYEVGSVNEERVAVFCHGGLGLTWLSHLLAIPLSLMWAGFYLPPSSASIVLMDERVDGIATPRCIGLALTSHLYKAGLPVRRRGVVANFD